MAIDKRPVGGFACREVTNEVARETAKGYLRRRIVRLERELRGLKAIEHRLPEKFDEAGDEILVRALYRLEGSSVLG
jgi:hypothetical protein